VEENLAKVKANSLKIKTGSTGVKIIDYKQFDYENAYLIHI